MVHPQCRGYVHGFIQLFTNNSFDLRTQLQIPAHSAAGLLNNPKTAHLAAEPFSDLRTQLQILSYKTLYALSCRGHPHTQLGLNLKPRNRP